MTDEPLAETPLSYFRSQIRACTACPRHRDSRMPVAFHFPLGADVVPDILLVMPAPGVREDRAGVPIDGPSLRRLDEWLQQAGLGREHDIVITNVVKCGVGSAQPADTATCMRKWFVPELRFFKPRLVVAFGREVQAALTGAKFFTPGSWKTPEGKPAQFFTYHPLATLQNPRMQNAFFRHASDVRRFLA